MGYYLDRRREAFKSQMADAKRRGIAFLFSFDEWWEIWDKSGKWPERGVRRGQYCMSRPDDKGAYEPCNVRIVLVGENHAERNRLNPLQGERHPSYGKNGWYLFGRRDPVVKAKFKQAMIRVAANRQRDERGCFLPRELAP